MVEKTMPDRVTIERTFAAPPGVIWELWTQPEHFAFWYGPEGSTVPVAKMDVRVGGARLLCMEVQTPQGARRLWFTGTYLEVAENQRLVYTDAMADEHGNVVAPEKLGMPVDHPAITEVRVQLEPVSGGTRMVLTHVGIPEGSPGAAGWASALDKLAEHWTRRGPGSTRTPKTLAHRMHLCCRRSHAGRGLLAAGTGPGRSGRKGFPSAQPRGMIAA